MAERRLLALFNSAQKAANATDHLAEVGIGNDRWEVLTGTPYPEGAFGERPARIRLFVFPFIGAALGLTTAILLTAGTQVSYPLVTGGKPVLSIPAMAIIAYEGTMLGAILFTILGIIFESRLPSFRITPYDRRITEGYVGILVRCPEDRVVAVERVLRQAGADEIRVEGES